MLDFSNFGWLALLAGSAALSFLVLAYRWPRAAAIRRAVDATRERVTGRRDWSWVRLWHVMVPLVVLSAVNVGWQVGTLHCADDSIAIFLSGRAAVTGHNPFQVTFCGEPQIDPIPYGLAQVAIDGFAALFGTVAALWIVWQAVALLVVPLVWYVGGEDRRYLSVLTAVSVLYLPNIVTNIGIDNTIVAISVLVMLAALGRPRSLGRWGRGVAAFLSTARFPAVFPLLASSASLSRRRWTAIGTVLGVFAGAIVLSYGLWGWDAVGVVYLGQLSRANGGTLNFFAVLLHQGYVLPSLVSAALQGAAILGLVLFAHLRRYPPAVACALPLLGVMLLSQYLTSQFVVWIVPVVLLGASANFWLLIYGTAAAIDYNFAELYLGRALGIWWPYELTGVLLSALLVYLLVLIVRDAEAGVRPERAIEPSPSARAATRVRARSPPDAVHTAGRRAASRTPPPLQERAGPPPAP